MKAAGVRVDLERLCDVKAACMRVNVEMYLM